MNISNDDDDDVKYWQIDSLPFYVHVFGGKTVIAIQLIIIPKIVDISSLICANIENLRSGE